MLKYNIAADKIDVCYSGIEYNVETADAVNKFIFEISKGKNVFLYTYRLPDEDLSKLVDSSVVLNTAKDLLNPHNAFFQLKEAIVESKNFDCACEAVIYCFENNVSWTDFLASSVIEKPMKCIEKGLLAAYFISGDQGADFWFGCNRIYESEALDLIEKLKNEDLKGKKAKHGMYRFRKDK